jgi:hypothetical protein
LRVEEPLDEALVEVPRGLDLIFADRRVEAGADEPTESRASSMGWIGYSRIDCRVGCLRPNRSLPLGVSSSAEND